MKQIAIYFIDIPAGHAISFTTVIAGRRAEDVSRLGFRMREKRDSMAKRLLCLLAVISFALGVVSAGGCSGTQTSEDDSNSKTDWVTYSNSDYGFMMSYPSGWTKQEQLLGTVVAFLSPKDGTSDAFQENVIVTVEDLTANPMSLNEYWGLSLNQCSKLITDFNVIESGGTTVAGKPANQDVYTGRQGQYELKYMQIGTIWSEPL